MKKPLEWPLSRGGRLSLLLLASLLLFGALADPAVTLPRDSYDFLFAIDITGSMNVADAGPSGGKMRRLAFVKQLISEAVDEMPCGSRAGLAIFTEHRSLLLFAPIEICENHFVISTMIDRIDWRMAWAELSEVAKGIYSGMDAVANLAAMDEGSGRRSCLVFLTDGHEAPPVHPTLRPRFPGQPGEVAGLIAGVGGPVPVPIPWLDENDRVVGYWAQDDVMQVDRQSLGRPSTQGGEAMAGVDRSGLQARIASGTEHLSSLRESYLKQLAAETGLDYVRATDGPEFVRALLDSKFAKSARVVTDIAWIPAALSLACLVYLFAAQLLCDWRLRVERHRRQPGGGAPQAGTGRATGS